MRGNQRRLPSISRMNAALHQHHGARARAAAAGSSTPSLDATSASIGRFSGERPNSMQRTCAGATPAGTRRERLDLVVASRPRKRGVLGHRDEGGSG